MRTAVCPQEACTLCMACANVCPQNAIGLSRDSFGYETVTINQELCVDCGLCEKVCKSRETVARNLPVRCYAAQAKDHTALEKSASGGAFQMLAQLVLEAGGVCYGCTMEKENGQFRASHIRVESMIQLPAILGSKYIPSIIGETFRQAKADLEAGRQVLFSGTPCQIQGLKAFLKKDYERLLTADLVCHGITAAKIFNDYVAALEQWEGIAVESYSFRDKSVSWGSNYCYTYSKEQKGKILQGERHCAKEEASYSFHYLKGNISRENCYSCKLASGERVGDVTLGDFWEIEREHPEFITRSKPRMVLRKGISCLLVNTEKAMRYISALEDKMLLRPVSLETISRHNGNLCAPTKRGKKRQWFLETYPKEGYGAIEKAYRETVGKKLAIYKLKNAMKSRLPDRVRIWIYRSEFLRRIVFRS